MSGGDLGGFSMLALFRMEVETHAAVLNEGLLALEREPLAVEKIEPLMRAAHSIKGAARIVQLDAAVKLAHVLEDFFVSVQEGKVALRPDHADVLLQGVDMLNRISQVGEAEITAWLAEHTGEIDSLVHAVRGLPAAAPQPGSPPPPGQPAPTATVPPPQAVPQAPPTPAPILADMSMLDLFRMEAETHSATLSEGLLALEREPGTPERIEPLMRAAHSIKGAARIVQLDIVVKLAHALEDYFVAVQEGKVALQPDHVDLLLQAVDTLARLGKDPVGGAPEQEVAGQVSALQDLKAGKAPPAKSGGGAVVSVPVAEAPVQLPVEVAAPAALPSAAPPPRASAPAGDAVVRITASHLNRLMGLAGESLVETRWLQPFAQSLLQLRRQQAELGKALEQLRGTLDDPAQLARAGDQVRAAQQHAAEFRRLLTDRYNEFETFARHSANLSDRLYHEVVASRMRPFADGVKGFPRLVRDLARTLGKKVKLEVLGPDTPVDRDILEKLEAPLNHMLRNAMDHGIELPADRLAAGKPEEATIKLEARHRAGMLAISIVDDGRGVDLDRLRQKILTKGLAGAEMVAGMSEAELLEFLFLPGFSTAAQVTEISGRGVGLDVVQNMIQEVRGVVRAVTQPGKGMAFYLQLPLTLSVLRALLVEIGGEPYALPLARLERLLVLPREEVSHVEGRPCCTIDLQQVGLVDACQVLELETTRPDGPEWQVVVLGERGARYGLVVDRLLGQRDLVVRPLDPRLGKVQDVSAVAVLADGSPVLIVDVEDMTRTIEKLLGGDRLRSIGGAVEGGRQRKRILVVDDSLTVREVERQLLEQHGYEVEVAVDGMDGWNAVRASRFDLVISDVDMPRMNGIELVSRIKQDPELRSIPVTIVSYKDREEDRMRGMDAGADYYLTKGSFQDQSLLKAVADLIGGPTG